MTTLADRVRALEGAKQAGKSATERWLEKHIVEHYGYLPSDEERGAQSIAEGRALLDALGTPRSRGRE